LIKLYNANKDIVSGVYMQRKEDKQILELYKGGTNISHNELTHGLMEVDGCGFGCVLVKSSVFNEMKYPHFVYKSALNHNNTYSEDTYFCDRAREQGFKIWVDTTLVCGHKGSYEYTPAIAYSAETQERKINEHLIELSKKDLLPEFHKNYLSHMKVKWDFDPKVIYDIGASCLHWTNTANKVWNSEYYAFDALEEYKDVYEYYGIKYAIACLSNKKELRTFHTNVEHPAGGSLYIEKNHKDLYHDHRKIGTITLDEMVELNDWPVPDMIKIDVQGAEEEVLRGAIKTLKSVQHLIVEVQSEEYNEGAPLKKQTFTYLEEIGFKMVEEIVNYGPDADYHFIRKNLYK